MIGIKSPDGRELRDPLEPEGLRVAKPRLIAGVAKLGIRVTW